MNNKNKSLADKIPKRVMVTDLICSGYAVLVCIINHSGNKQSIPRMWQLHSSEY